MRFYYRNRPLKILWVIPVNLLWDTIFYSPFIALPALGIWGNTFLVWTTPRLKYGVLLLLSCTFLVIFVRMYCRSLKESFACRIIPYFESRVGIEESFSKGPFKRGFALLKNCALLDRIAEEHAATPLSAFGFRDEHFGSAPRWHDPSEGIRTLTAIQAELPPGLDSEALQTDLALNIKALELAHLRKVRFCFLLRTGYDKAISPVEMDNRKGSFG